MSDDEARESCLERTSYPLFHPKKSKMLSRGRIDMYGMGMEEPRGLGSIESFPLPADSSEETKRRTNQDAGPSSLQHMQHSSAGSGGINPFVMNPLLAMGFQLPQLALLMQQQQQQQQQQQSQQQHQQPLHHHHHHQQQAQQQQQQQQHHHHQHQHHHQQQHQLNQSNLNLPSSSSSSSSSSPFNPLLLPHILASSSNLGEMHQKSWSQFAPPVVENIPSLQPVPLSTPQPPVISAPPEPMTGTIMSAGVNSNAIPRLSVKGLGEKQPIVAQKDDIGPGKQPFVCDLCREWFFSREKLVMHLVMNHSMQHCRFCAELFESREMREEHELSVHLPLECDMCQASLPSQETLSEHYLLGHDVRNCQFCGVLVRPKSYYAVHVRRKHFVAPEVMVEEGKVRIVRRWDTGANGASAWTFTCHLCGKERKRTETFGHFYSYHRLSLLCLIQLLTGEGVIFSVQGTPAPSSSNVQSSVTAKGTELGLLSGLGDESSNNDASHNSGTAISSDDSLRRRSSTSSCTVCTNPFSVQVPKPAHDLFCRGLTLCRYCDRTFTSKSARNAHAAKDHGDLVCRVGCPPEVSFSQEYELSAHYLQDHNLHMCHYCSSLVPTMHNQFTQHLRTVHNCTENSSALEDFGSGIGIDLFQCKYSETSLSVSCSLCNADITSFMKDINSIFKHIQYHSIGLPSALHLLETNLIFDIDLCTTKKEKNVKSHEQDFRDFELSGGTSSLWDSLLPTEADVQSIKARKSKPGPKKSSASNAKKINYLSDQEVSMMTSTVEEGNSRTRSEGSRKHSKEADNAKEKNGERHGASKSTDDPNFDSSSELASSEDEEQFLPSEGEGGDNDISDEDDEEYTPASDRKTKQHRANAEAEATEAEFDPGEVECVFTDTSDEEIEENNLPSTVKIKQEPDDGRRELESGGGDSNSFSEEKQEEGVGASSVIKETPRSALRSGPESEHVMERTMQQIFGAERSQGNLNEPGDQLLPVKDLVIKQELETDGPTINKRSLACDICQGNFFAEEGARELARHMSSLHGFSLRPYRGKQEAFKKADLFSCPFCMVQARTRPAMRQHVQQTHSTDLEKEVPTPHLAYSCRHCKNLFWRIADRDDHQVNVHSDQMMNFFKCHVCLKVFSSKVCLNRHAVSEHKDSTLYAPMSFKCKLCLVMLPDLTILRQHFREHHPTSLVFHCYRCNTTLKTKKTLRSHIKNVHSEARRKDCNLCGKVLWSKRAHAIHYRMKHSVQSKVGFRCRICQKRFDSKDERKLHYQVDHEGESPYHCNECGKGFASKSGMYGHRQLHTGSGVSKCEYCGKEFTRKDSYNEHLLIHNGPRHKCPHCPKEFVQRSNLVRHIRIHTGEKPYKCLYCEKCFSDKGACNSHIRVHTREETCSCPYCGQTFSKKQKLKYHIRKHTGEGLISCEICSKSFTNSFALKEHRVIHNRQTQILCQQCGKGFNSEKYLQRHVAIVHEPSNAFACPLCPKVFSQHARLKAHLMTHTGVKHIKCLLCEKAYSVRKSLRRHLLEKHQISPEHPQYKHCFYAMSAEEAGLRIPEGAGPFVPDPSAPQQTFEKKPVIKGKAKKPPTTARKYPRKTPGRKGPSRRGVTKTSAPFEVYETAGDQPSGEVAGEGTSTVPVEPRRKYATRKTAAAAMAAMMAEVILTVPGEDSLSEGEVSPSTSTVEPNWTPGRGRPKSNRQKASPRKVPKKEIVDTDDTQNDAAEVPTSEDVNSNNPEVAPVSPPKKRSPGRPPGTGLKQMKEVKQQEPDDASPLPSSPSKIKKAQATAGTTGRKKRRVEAIVEILQKTGSSPSSGSTKEEEEEEEGAIVVKKEVEEAEEVEGVPAEDNNELSEVLLAHRVNIKEEPHEPEEQRQGNEDDDEEEGDPLPPVEVCINTVEEEEEEEEEEEDEEAEEDEEEEEEEEELEEEEEESSNDSSPVLARILPLNSPNKGSGPGRRIQGGSQADSPAHIIVRSRTTSSKSDEDLS
ncbi:uncharacterized protein [Anabrus simplex]|uniref:uncharacterized protein n=1 Tax=Anabrus simplex TaxID=316456 RepID=UPI0035A2C2BC